MSRLRRRSRLHLIAFAVVVSAGTTLIVGQNAATSVAIDAAANRHPINPHIYGFGFASTSDLSTTNFTMNRYGGNASTTYNWQINGDNRGNDWYFESYADSSATPGQRGDDFITSTRAAGVGAEPLITIPMINYIGKVGANRSSLASFSIARYGPQTGHDPYNADAGNGISTAAGNPYITGNNPNDAATPNSVSIQQAWVQHIVNTWGPASNAGLKYYIMDNEHSLWNSTHRDLHPTGTTYNEIYNDFVTYAGAVRAVDPNAMIAGPEEWGWLGQFFSGLDQQNGAGGSGSDYNTHGQTYYYPWLLQQLHNYQLSTGKQLLNVLTVHYYPQDGSGSNDDSAGTQLIRNRSTRSLWDPNYVDQSWINQVGINGGKVNLIPNLKSWVSQYYPGLQVGITEYNWGDESQLNGATTQADVLGIFGREGLDLATRWTVPVNPSPTYLAMQIYRNYDGRLSTFGDTSVSAAVTNPDNLSAFAAVRSSDSALTVMVINKQTGSTPVNISLANFATSGTADQWQISSATQAAITHAGSVAIANNTISTTVPSQSITLFVIPAGNTTSLPSAPTGLAATVGNGTVALTWNAGGGATSYIVKRATVSGGPYTTIATVTSPTSYNDSGLTNGTTYYYVVAGTNSAGTGPNPPELAATPIAPPTFTSSALASPNPVSQGAATTINATVTCTANTLNNGNVQIYVIDPSGNNVATQNFTGQSFTPNQSRPYSMALTPLLAGTYTVEVGVFSATWQQWSWNASAGAITVSSSTAFTSSAAANPSSILVGASSSISATVTETGTSGLTNANIELQIFNKSGTAVATNVWSGQNFTAGQSHPYAYTWSPGSSIATGVYSVAIGVFDSGWTHNYSWNGSATTITVTSAQPPAVPTGLTATAGNTQVTLTWTATTGATSYNVYRGTSAGGEGSAAIKTGLTSPSFTNTGLTNGIKYYYKVAAVNTAGTSTLSAEASATPQGPPATPTGLAATAGAGQIALSWKAASGATSYSLYRSTTSGGEGSTPIHTGITGTTFTDTGLSKVKYYYKVAAVNAIGTSALSSEASARPR